MEKCEEKTYKHLAAYLETLLKARGITAREVARRSKIIAEQEGNPDLELTHQSVSNWVAGLRRPLREHRPTLATILQIPIPELNAACDGEGPPKLTATLRHVAVEIATTDHVFGYDMLLKSGIDLSQPSIYRKWSDMFSTSELLDRHFRNGHHELFGWVPDNSAQPLITHPMSLLPLTIPKGPASSILGTAQSNIRHVCFAYLPGGKLDFGIAYRDGRSFVLAKNTSKGVISKTYALGKVELVGYFSGRTMFRLLKATLIANGSETENGNKLPQPATFIDQLGI